MALYFKVNIDGKDTLIPARKIGFFERWEDEGRDNLTLAWKGVEALERERQFRLDAEVRYAIKPSMFPDPPSLTDLFLAATGLWALRKPKPLYQITSVETLPPRSPWSAADKVLNVSLSTKPNGTGALWMAVR